MKAIIASALSLLNLIFPPPTPTVRTMEVTAYTIAYDETGRGDGVTASGELGIPHLTVASDDLPFYTRIRINGKEYIVHDRFGGGYTDRIDILMDTKEECFAWGRQIVEVEILD